MRPLALALAAAALVSGVTPAHADSSREEEWRLSWHKVEQGVVSTVRASDTRWTVTVERGSPDGASLFAHTSYACEAG